MEKTNVKFYVHKGNNELFALFPDDINPWDGNEFTGYAHIGQHSMINILYIKESRVAKKSEYLELYNELTNIVGYDLNVMNNEK